MDRDPNDLSTSPNTTPGGGMYGTGGASGTSGTSGSTDALGTAGGAPIPVRGADMPSSVSSSSTSTAEGMQGSAGSSIDRAKDSAQDRLGEAREQLSDRAVRARGWKRSMEQKLADRLHDGASRLREKASSMPATSGSTGAPEYAGATAGSTGSGSAAVADRAKSVEQNLARGMDATADWLRNGDLQTTVEEQARSNPARTLLIALGVGYLLGKTLKR